MLFFAICLGVALAAPMLGVSYKGMAAEADRQAVHDAAEITRRR